jgi:phospholipid transport system transporter-binding protein
MTASVQRAGERLAVVGSMTIETAGSLLQAGVQAMQGADAEFDLAAVTEVDSAGLAVLFGWQRLAQTQGKSLRITNLPRNLTSLAEVYGVSDLLPLLP